MALMTVLSTKQIERVVRNCFAESVGPSQSQLNGVNMPLNTRKIMIGGLVAGIVIILLNILAQFVLGERVQHEMNA